MTFGVVVRSTGETTYPIVLDALRGDPFVADIETVRDSYPLFRAAAATHRAFSRWSDRYEHVFSIDADVVPLPGFGARLATMVHEHPYPAFSRWLPPLLDWVVQGRWRTAGGIFCYRSAECSAVSDRFEELADAVEPEHSSAAYESLAGREWRPANGQDGEIVSVHQFGLPWEFYYYRGLVHTLRRKNWIRPGALLLAMSGQPENRVFLEGVCEGLRNPTILRAEDASFRSSPIFRELYAGVLQRLQLASATPWVPATYDELLDRLNAQMPPGMSTPPVQG